ncbi:unnamed protein product [Lampetra planeri]
MRLHAGIKCLRINDESVHRCSPIRQGHGALIRRTWTRERALQRRVVGQTVTWARRRRNGYSGNRAGATANGAGCQAPKIPLV